MAMNSALQPIQALASDLPRFTDVELEGLQQQIQQILILRRMEARHQAWHAAHPEVVFVSDAEIDAEVEAVRASRYASGIQ
jgi:hypothetical protein